MLLIYTLKFNTIGLGKEVKRTMVTVSFFYLHTLLNSSIITFLLEFVLVKNRSSGS